MAYLDEIETFAATASHFTLTSYRLCAATGIWSSWSDPIVIPAAEVADHIGRCGRVYQGFAQVFSVYEDSRDVILTLIAPAPAGSVVTPRWY